MLPYKVRIANYSGTRLLGSYSMNIVEASSTFLYFVGKANSDREWLYENSNTAEPRPKHPTHSTSLDQWKSAGSSPLSPAVLAWLRTLTVDHANRKPAQLLFLQSPEFLTLPIITPSFDHKTCGACCHDVALYHKNLVTYLHANQSKSMPSFGCMSYLSHRHWLLSSCANVQYRRR